MRHFFGGGVHHGEPYRISDDLLGLEGCLQSTPALWMRESLSNADKNWKSCIIHETPMGSSRPFFGMCSRQYVARSATGCPEKGKTIANIHGDGLYLSIFSCCGKAGYYLENQWKEV